jgi:hypothetical protein
MADRVLFLSWGTPARGREERGLETFNDAVGLYGRLQQDGRIESFDVVLLEPNGGIEGYMVLKGSREQMNDVRADQEFQRIVTEAALVVDDMRVVEGACNDGISNQMEMYREAISSMPTTA